MAPQVPQLCQLCSPTERRLLWAQPQHRVSPPALVNRECSLFVPAGFCSADPLCSLRRRHPSALAALSIPGLCDAIPQGKKYFFFFFKGKEKYFPSLQAARLPSSPPQRHLMLYPAQGQGHSSACVVHSAPASLSAAGAQRGWRTLSVPGQMCSIPETDVLQHPACPRALAIAGTGLVGRSGGQVAMPSWQEPGEIRLALAKRAQPFAWCLIRAECCSSTSGKELLHMAGGGGDEPRVPVQLPAASGVGARHRCQNEHGVGCVHTSAPESPSQRGGGFGARAGGVKPPATSHS